MDVMLEKLYQEIRLESTELAKSPLKEIVPPGEFFSNCTLVSFQALEIYEGEAFVVNLFSQMLGRTPTEEELTHHVELLKSGKMTKKTMFCAFGLSGECIDADKIVICKDINNLDAGLFLRLNNEQFVKAIYCWILGRPASHQEYQTYLELIEGGMPKKLVLYNMSRSEEARKRHIQISGLPKAVYYLKLVDHLKRTVRRAKG